MGNFDKGILVFHEWIFAAKVLSGTEFKKLIISMQDYQLEGKEPPHFTPKGEAIARVVFPCLKRRVDGAKSIGRGAQGVERDDHPASPYSYPRGYPYGVNYRTPYPKEKKSKEKYSTSSMDAEHWQEFFNESAERALKTAAPTDEPSVPSENI